MNQVPHLEQQVGSDLSRKAMQWYLNRWGNISVYWAFPVTVLQEGRPGPWRRQAGLGSQVETHTRRLLDHLISRCRPSKPGGREHTGHISEILAGPAERSPCPVALVGGAQGIVRGYRPPCTPFLGALNPSISSSLSPLIFSFSFLSVNLK